MKLSLKILFFYFIMGSYLSRKETFLAEKTITKKGMTEADSF